MAGARIEFDANTRDAGAALAAAARQLGPEGRTLLLQDIGEYLMSSTRARAAKQVSPDGQAWAALSPRYAAAKAKKRPGLPILRFDNHMIGDQLVSQVEGDTLLHGTNAPYGAINQFGGDIEIPARPTQVYFHHKGGEVSPHFVTKRKATFVQDATIPEHVISIPARPWLGLDADDITEITQLVADHVTGALEGASP
ncbi:MAG: phage virion morphogenesis protein [Luteibacter sp.]